MGATPPKPGCKPGLLFYGNAEGRDVADFPFLTLYSVRMRTKSDVNTAANTKAPAWGRADVSFIDFVLLGFS